MARRVRHAQSAVLASILNEEQQAHLLRWNYFSFNLSFPLERSNEKYSRGDRLLDPIGPGVAQSRADRRTQ
jgi:hypothetical protein